MIAATVCSGIGAPEVAMPHWQYTFQSEVEAFPLAVLKHRHGAQDARYSRASGPALWGDFTTIRVRFLRRLRITLPQWLIAGTPCQAFSLAGLRQSLADNRGNLTLEFVRLGHSLRRAGSLRGFTWENVPGVLATKDNAFGCFLAAVVGADAPLHSPLERGRWPDSGMVAGPWARVAWRVFDAQYFGLAQRRRRVFVVASFGNGPDPAAILFERQGMYRHSPPSRSAGEGIAGTLEARSEGGGFPGTDGACSGHDVPAGGVAFGGNNTSGPIDIATAVNWHGGPHGRLDFESETFVTTAALDASYGRLQGCSGQDANHGHSHLIPEVTHSLRAEGCDASEDGTGRGTPLVPVAFSCKDYAQDATAGLGTTLRSMSEGDGNQNGGGQVAVAFHDVAGTLKSCGGQSGTPNGAEEADRLVGAVGFMENQRAELRTSEVVNLTVGGGKPGQGYPAALTASHVRRLTPRECERLQGFPDDFTLVPYRGKPAADGPRYKALGNSMAVPVLGWIGRRIEAAEAILVESEAAA